MKRMIIFDLLLILIFMFVLSCSKDNKTNPDIEPPTVFITNPSDNSIFNSGSVIYVIVEAEDNEEISSVEFYIDGESSNIDDSEPYEYNWDTTGLSDSHAISALATDSSENSTISDTVTVSIINNGEAPNHPSNPDPANNAIEISIYSNLFWECTDPENDPLTYDIYFGLSSSPPLLVSEQSDTYFDPGILNEETTYYWKIRAHDNHTNFTDSDIWEFTTISGSSGTVTDIDGNVYQTLVIGNQEWMIENLKVTHYRNGDEIPHVISSAIWVYTPSAYCFYDNIPANADIYGNLYNWYTVNDSRNIAPEGWHIPTDEEFQELEIYLGMDEIIANSIGYRGTNEGSKLAGRADLWLDGPLENNPVFDTSGFGFLPGGFRSFFSGSYDSINSYGYIWSSSEYSNVDAISRGLNKNYWGVNRDHKNKAYGYSVRCVKD